MKGKGDGKYERKNTGGERRGWVGGPCTEDIERVCEM